MRAAPTRTVSSPAPPTEAPDVSVVVVNYNVREFLEQALDSLAEAAAGLRVEVFVVDNNSADGSVQMVRERFPDVHIIENDANVGFARANNQAICEAQGRYVLLLNPDTLVQEDTLQALVRFMDAHPEAGAVGCRILNPDGTFAPESRRAFPTPSVAFYRLTGLSRLFPGSPTFGRYNLTYLPRDEVCEVDALSGSCMMVRRAALYRSRAEQERLDPSASGGDGLAGAPPHASSISSPPLYAQGAGLLDEDFFMYGEDLDWCYRIQRAGWRIYYTPETQIIHYKGESTKKGELRYVRLFYGAMLRFVEKHFSGNAEASWWHRIGSRGLALGLRLGILVRAFLTFGARAFAALRAPLLDVLLAGGAIAATAAVWATSTAAGFGTTFYGVVVPIYALTVVLCVAFAGAYRRGRRGRLRPVLTGLIGAFFVVATLSFFIKTIAFSRAAVLFGFAAAGLGLVGWRMVLGAQQNGFRRVLVVGSAREAARLHRLVAGRIKPSATLLGYVSDEPSDGSAIPLLGPTRHLRDLVRLRDADEVVFAADALSNTAILRLMHQLRDLPVQLKILASGRDRLIGKASIEDFSVPFVEAERAVAPLRSPAARRLLETPVALFGMALHPLVRLALRLRPANAYLRRLAAATARMPSVLAGRRALVGYDTASHRPPPDWGLLPGVISILDTLSERPTSIVEVHRAYWFYARNQSVALDVEILIKALLARPSS